MNKLLSMILLAILFLSQPAYALDLGEAKARGLVGETLSGYLAPISSGDPAVTQLVNSINDQRKQYYQDIARKNNTPLQTVEQLAGKKAIEKTPAGQFVNTGSGWRKK